MEERHTDSKVQGEARMNAMSWSFFVYYLRIVHWMMIPASLSSISDVFGLSNGNDNETRHKSAVDRSNETRRTSGYCPTGRGD
jgi:hypothetical protein